MLQGQKSFLQDSFKKKVGKLLNNGTKDSEIPSKLKWSIFDKKERSILKVAGDLYLTESIITSGINQMASFISKTYSIHIRLFTQQEKT